MLPSSSRPTLAALSVLAALLSSTGCGERAGDDAPAGPAPRIWTLRHLRERAASGLPLPAALAVGEPLTLRGRPLAQWSPPYHRLERLQAQGQDGFNVLPAFIEGRPAAFTVLEVWEHVPEVWVQPWYVLVTEYDAAHPDEHRLKGALPVVDIGADSVFYSPFWELTYVVVPRDTPPDRYRSAVDLHSSGLRMYRGGGLLAPLAPADVAPVRVEGGATPLRPLSGDSVSTPARGEVWLRGRRVTYLDFGMRAFTWNKTAERNGVVDESPLYLFATPDATGRPVSLGLPPVLGPGPAANRTASGTPRADTPALSRVPGPELGASQTESVARRVAAPGPSPGTGPEFSASQTEPEALRLAAPGLSPVPGPGLSAGQTDSATLRFGALTRPHLVLLPPGAGPFIPAELRQLKASLRARGVTVVDAHPTAEHLAEAKDYVLRVALNPECFKDLAGFPQACRWLDSRAAVEANVEPTAVFPQDVLFTSPQLSFTGWTPGS